MFKREMRKQTVDVEVEVGTCDVCEEELTEYAQLRLAKASASPYLPVRSGKPLDVCTTCLATKGSAIKLVLDTKRNEMLNDDPLKDNKAEYTSYPSAGVTTSVNKYGSDSKAF